MGTNLSETCDFFFVRDLDGSGLVDVRCIGDEHSLDECQISPSIHCSTRRRPGLVLLACGPEKITPRCGRAAQSLNRTMTKGANCDDLSWFVCEAEPQHYRHE